MQYSLRVLLSYIEAVAGVMVSMLPKRGCRAEARRKAAVPPLFSCTTKFTYIHNSCLIVIKIKKFLAECFPISLFSKYTSFFDNSHLRTFTRTCERNPRSRRFTNRKWSKGQNSQLGSLALFLPERQKRRYFMKIVERGEIL